MKQYTFHNPEKAPLKASYIRLENGFSIVIPIRDWNLLGIQLVLCLTPLLILIVLFIIHEVNLGFIVITSCLIFLCLYWVFNNLFGQFVFALENNTLKISRCIYFPFKRIKFSDINSFEIFVQKSQAYSLGRTARRIDIDQMLFLDIKLKNNTVHRYGKNIENIYVAYLHFVITDYLRKNG